MKRIITEALGERAVQIMERTDQFVRNRRKSDEQKSMMEKRNMVVQRVGRLYRQLVQELFPDMSVSLETMLNDDDRKLPAEEEINNLAEKVANMNVSDIGGEECPVCYEKETDENEFVYTNPCVHFFCVNCIRQHVKANGKNCPVCRDPLVSILREGVVYPFKEPTKAELTHIYKQQQHAMKEKTRLLENQKAELEAELTSLREQVQSNEEFKYEPEPEVETDPTIITEQVPRPPRRANSNHPPGFRTQAKDQYYTPTFAVMLLLRVLGNTIAQLATGKYFSSPSLFIFFYPIICSGGLPILEPACGDGRISKVLKDMGYAVIEQDLYSNYVSQHIDYLTSTDPAHCFLITNPPYILKFLFLKKAFESGIPFAMLLPFTCFTTVMGSELFEKYSLKIYAFRRCLNFTHDGQESVFHDMAWLVGNVGEKRPFFELYYIDHLDKKLDQDLANVVVEQTVV